MTDNQAGFDARENELAKIRNEIREAEGKIDRGTPASSSPAKSILEMSDAEWQDFKRYRRR